MRRVVILIVAAVLVGACGSGSPVPVDTAAVTGHVHAGPTCPVVKNPPDPACADRPVSGAVLVVRDPSGTEIRSVVSDGAGNFTIRLEPGDYELVPQPVEGLLGTAPPQAFTVPATLDVAYDTGIR